jgi:hypothetical protein
VVGAAQAAAKQSACRDCCFTPRLLDWWRRARPTSCNGGPSTGARERISRQRAADSGYSRRWLEPWAGLLVAVLWAAWSCRSHALKRGVLQSLGGVPSS